MGKLLLILLLLPVLLFGIEKQENLQYTGKKRSDTLWIPLAFYSLDTSFGALGMVMHFSGDDLYMGTAMYTIEHQGMGMFKGGWTLFHPKVYGELSAMASRFPKKFFGVGDNTSLDDEKLLTRRHLKFQGVLKYYFHKKRLDKISLGVLLETNYMVEEEDEAEALLGNDGGRFNAFGVQFIFDQRNSKYYPTGGQFMKGELLLFPGVESDHRFQTFKIDYRTYFMPLTNHILAFQGLVQFSRGKIPVQLMPRLGGPMMLRGYLGGRFIDRHYLAAQGEYRFPLSRRWGGAVFYGIGDVFNEFSDLDSEWKHGFGGGIRFTIETKRKINMRLDFAMQDLTFKEDHYGVYFSIMEAF